MRERRLRMIRDKGEDPSPSEYAAAPLEEQLRDIAGNLADAVTALEGLGCEVEALVTVHRAMAARTLGTDVLSNTPYSDMRGENSPRGEDEEPSISGWVNHGRKRVRNSDPEERR